ncbi:MAG: glycolate oxidase subunit GlcE [Burkholderiaceae bacterium]
MGLSHDTADASAAEWIRAARDQVAQARAQTSTLRIEGHGSKSFYGQPPQGDGVLQTAPYSGVVNHDPTELVVVVRAGTPIETLESVLAEKRQRLAFEPPRFHGSAAGRGTVGGMVASGLSGPGRFAAGPCRDFVLGMTVMDADGQLMRYGGTVMKNVAGYDLSRLHTGAMGILGLILDVALKVLPEPAASATVQLPMAQAEALERVNAWSAEPLPLSATAWLPDQGGQLHLRFAGAAAAVSSAVGRFGHEMAEDQAKAFWLSLRDQTHRVFALPEPPFSLWRVSLPTRADVFPLGETLLTEWGGGLRWVRASETATAVRLAAAQLGGHATLYRSSSESSRQAGVFTPLSPALGGIHQRLKQELDPAGLWNPGRLLPGL